MEPLNLSDFEEIARKTLSKMAFDYIAGGATDETTLRENRAAYDRFRLRPRVLVDVSACDLSTEIFGQPVSFPVLIAPCAFHRLAHPDGELATARAATDVGTIMVLSTAATYSIEEVAAVATGPLWFQLYAYKDRAVTQTLVQRAYAAGFQALCLTVDAPYLGSRERDIRNQFTLPPGMEWRNLVDVSLESMPEEYRGSALAAYIAELWEPSLTWRDVEWLASLTPMPVVLKGIMGAEDAVLAVEHGAAGIVVSNHGGRQLDGVPATLDILPEIVDAVGDRTEVLMDGGIRRGTDVLKALALGAKAVMVGRPILWGLAYDGEAGVRRVLEILRAELDLAMALAGRPDLAAVDRSLVVPAPYQGAQA